MKAWSYTAESSSGADRERVWGEALQHVSLPASRLADQSGFHGRVSSVTSPLGIELSRIASSAQTISGSCASRAPCLWIALPVEGMFLLADGTDELSLEAGDILYGPAGRDSTLRLPGPFAMLYIRIPQAMLHPRLLNLQGMSVGMLKGRAAVNRVFSSLLHAVFDNLEDLTDDHLRPIEVALSEFVVASLAECSAQGAFDRAGASNFRRICQAIELQLGDGDLTLQHVAEQQNVSARYIQKLFQQAGMSFSPYLRQRRLEHCRADLASAVHRGLSISEICFRWGFNDAAHFSRSFRADFGMTPRAFRQDALARHARAH